MDVVVEGIKHEDCTDLNTIYEYNDTRYVYMLCL